MLGTPFRVRSQSTVHRDLEQAIREIAAELASRQPVGNAADFRVLTKGRSRPLNPIVLDEAYLLTQEALSNAFRHAHPRNIEAEVI